MTVHDTTANTTSTAAAVTNIIAKPLTQLSQEERAKITTELVRINSLVSHAADQAERARIQSISSRVADKNEHKDTCGNKAEGACPVDFKPTRD